MLILQRQFAMSDLRGFHLFAHRDDTIESSRKYLFIPLNSIWPREWTLPRLLHYRGMLLIYRNREYERFAHLRRQHTPLFSRP